MLVAASGRFQLLPRRPFEDESAKLAERPWASILLARVFSTPLPAPRCRDVCQRTVRLPVCHGGICGVNQRASEARRGWLLMRSSLLQLQVRFPPDGWA